MTYPALLGGNPSTYTPITYQPPMSTTSGILNPPMANPTMQIGANGSRMADGGASYRKGGGVKRGKLVMIHAQPHELDGMDFLQGKVERDPRSGMRSYMHLEELLKNPHILSKVHQHIHEHHAAHGGHMGMIHSGNGMHGDTEIALIGPHTHRTFDHLAKAMGASEHDLRNPHDGHPQYFSLGGILGGLGSALGGIGSKALGALSGLAPSFGGMASKLSGILPSFGGAGNALSGLAGKAGNALGGMGEAAKNFYNSDLGQGLKNQALNMGKDYLSNKMAQSQNPYVQTLGQGFNAAGNAYLGGQSPRQALGQGIHAAGQNFEGGLGGALQNFGQSFGQGQGAMDTLRNTARGGYEGMGGAGGMMNMGMDALNNFRSGQAPHQAMGNMMMNHFHAMQPKRMTPGFINMEGEMPGMYGDLY